MGQKSSKTHMTQRERVEQEQALAYRKERSEKTKQVLKTIGVVIISVLLVIAFCFPAVTLLIN